MFNWQTILVVMFLLLGAGVSGRLAVFAWQRRNNAGARPFVLLAACLALWSAAYAAELCAFTLPAKTFWVQVQYLGISQVSVAWFLFAHGYTGHEEWFSTRRLLVLFAIPVLTVLSAFTNSYHHLQWAAYTLSTEGSFQVFSVLAHGPGWIVFAVYSYLLLGLGTLVLVRTLIAYSPIYRAQFIILLAGLLLPWLANVLYLARLSPVPALDLSPLAFAISAVILWGNLYRFRMFDLVPLGTAPVIDRLDSAAFVLDMVNRLVDVNLRACVYFDLRYNDVLGQPLDQVFKAWRQVDISVANALNINQTIPMLVGGVKRSYALQIAPIWNRRQQVTGRLILLRDVTADRLAEEALALAQVKTEFLAKVSHDLRTPLTSIIGVTEMLDYGVYGALTPEQKNALRLVFDSADRMTRLVNDLLEQSRLEKGNFRLNLSVFDLAEQLEKLCQQSEARARAKGLTMTLAVDPQLPRWVRGDPLRLYQVLNNLVDNAIKYTAAGEVRLRAQPVAANLVSFEVSDTGSGIPDELQSIIYDAFRQLSPSRNGNSHGFGLGLSIVKQLVTLMKGEIQLQSEVGKGSTFIIHLPLEDVAVKEAAV